MHFNCQVLIFQLTKLNFWAENCGKVGGEVQTAAQILDKAFKAQREFLRIVSKSQQPNPASLGELLKPTGAEMKTKFVHLTGCHKNQPRTDLVIDCDEIILLLILYFYTLLPL